MNKESVQLIEHVLAMKDDAYLRGHPEWLEIVKDARAARARDTDNVLDQCLDAVDRQLLKKPIKRYVGVAVFEWGKGQCVDVVFVSHDESRLLSIYSTYYGKYVSPCWVKNNMDAIDLAVDFAEKTLMPLPYKGIYHILELNADGWGLFQHQDDNSWKLVDSYDATQQQEIDLADQAHINDLRFGDHPEDYHPGDELHDPFGDMR